MPQSTLFGYLCATDTLREGRRGGLGWGGWVAWLSRAGFDAAELRLAPDLAALVATRRFPPGE